MVMDVNKIIVMDVNEELRKFMDIYYRLQKKSFEDPQILEEFEDFYKNFEKALLEKENISYMLKGLRTNIQKFRIFLNNKQAICYPGLNSILGQLQSLFFKNSKHGNAARLSRFTPLSKAISSLLNILAMPNSSNFFTIDLQSLEQKIQEDLKTENEFYAQQGDRKKQYDDLKVYFQQICDQIEDSKTDALYSFKVDYLKNKLSTDEFSKKQKSEPKDIIDELNDNLLSDVEDFEEFFNIKKPEGYYSFSQLKQELSLISLEMCNENPVYAYQKIDELDKRMNHFKSVLAGVDGIKCVIDLSAKIQEFVSKLHINTNQKDNSLYSLDRALRLQNQESTVEHLESSGLDNPLFYIENAHQNKEYFDVDNFYTLSEIQKCLEEDEDFGKRYKQKLRHVISSFLEKQQELILHIIEKMDSKGTDEESLDKLKQLVGNIKNNHQVMIDNMEGNPEKIKKINEEISLKLKAAINAFEGKVNQYKLLSEQSSDNKIESQIKILKQELPQNFDTVNRDKRDRLLQETKNLYDTLLEKNRESLTDESLQRTYPDTLLRSPFRNTDSSKDGTSNENPADPLKNRTDSYKDEPLYPEELANIFVAHMCKENEKIYAFLDTEFSAENLYQSLFNEHNMQGLKEKGFFKAVATELRVTEDDLIDKIFIGFSERSITDKEKATENRKRFKNQMNYLTAQRIRGGKHDDYEMPKESYNSRMLLLLDAKIHAFLKEASHQSWNVFRDTEYSEQYDQSVIDDLNKLLQHRNSLLTKIVGQNSKSIPPFQSYSYGSLVHFDLSQQVYVLETPKREETEHVVDALEVNNIGGEEPPKIHKIVPLEKRFVDKANLKRTGLSALWNELRLFLAWLSDKRILGLSSWQNIDSTPQTENLLRREAFRENQAWIKAQNKDIQKQNKEENKNILSLAEDNLDQNNLTSNQTGSLSKGALISHNEKSDDVILHEKKDDPNTLWRKNSWNSSKSSSSNKK